MPEKMIFHLELEMSKRRIVARVFDFSIQLNWEINVKQKPKIKR